MSDARLPQGQRHPWSGRVLAAALALVLPASLLAAEAPADPAQRAGWIDSFDGPAGGYALIRAGAPQPLGYLTPVQVGDRLEVRAADGLLRLRLGEGALTQLDQGQSPYSVPPVGAPPSLWGNLMDWASGWFTQVHAQGFPARPISAFSKGDDDTKPASGLLYSETVGLPAGQGPLALAWRGGTAPFRIALAPAGGGANPAAAATRLEQGGIPGREYRTPPLDLAPGTYRLTIADAAGRSLVTDLLVLPVAELPAPATGAFPADLPLEVRATLDAAWLASQEDGWGWRLAAYQRVADLRDYAPADLLRRALVEATPLPGGRAPVGAPSAATGTSTP